MMVGILVPGRGTTTEGPLLALADAALDDRGAHTERVAWTVPEGLLQVGPEPFVRAHVAAALHRAEAAVPEPRPVVIGKSLGSHAAALVAERGLPAVWLTPVLTDHAVTKAIAMSSEPALLIGGTADELWSTEAAQATGKRVLTVADGDHLLRVPGPLRRSTDVLGVVATAIEEFLDALTQGQG